MKRRPPRSAYQTIRRLGELKTLLRTQSLTRAEIVAALPVYDGDKQYKKLRRDLKALEALGYMAEQDPMSRRYQIHVNAPEVTWDQEQLQALAAIRELFRAGLPYAEQVQGLLSHLESGMIEPERRIYQQIPAISLSLQTTKDYHSIAPILRKLDKVVNKQRVLFDYNPPYRSERVHHRDVQPVKLVFRDGHYYLWGYSVTRGRYYEFRVDRIERGSLRVLPNRASAPPRRPMLGFQCLLSPKLTRGGTIPDFPVIDAMDPQSDGSMLITAQHYADFWIIQEVLRYGEQAQITSPGWLRKKLWETVQRMKEVYEP